MLSHALQICYFLVDVLYDGRAGAWTDVICRRVELRRFEGERVPRFSADCAQWPWLDLGDDRLVPVDYEPARRRQPVATNWRPHIEQLQTRLDTARRSSPVDVPLCCPMLCACVWRHSLSCHSKLVTCTPCLVFWSFNNCCRVVVTGYSSCSYCDRCSTEIVVFM